MASVKKFAQAAVPNQLRHNERLTRHPSNSDIDPSRSPENYSLLDNRSISSFDYYLQRLNEVHHMQREDVRTLAAWVVTAPQDLQVTQERLFFETTCAFLNERYGEANAIQAIVHKDEGGQPHLHYCFIPVVEDCKHGGEKVCAKEVLTRAELRNFHPALQKYLHDAGIECTVHSGITQEIGGNLTVEQLKRAEEYMHTRHYERGATW